MYSSGKKRGTGCRIAKMLRTAADAATSSASGAAARSSRLLGRSATRARAEASDGVAVVVVARARTVEQGVGRGGCRLEGLHVAVPLGAPCEKRRSATFMYMSGSVGVAELRQNLSLYLRRVARGERLIVTDRNRPVAELGPPPTGAELDRLIAAGRVSAPVRRSLPEPLELEGDPYALSRALDEIRGER